MTINVWSNKNNSKSSRWTVSASCNADNKAFPVALLVDVDIDSGCVCPAVDEGEMGVRRFMQEVMTQWRSLSMEVRSVRSMLEEVLSNWEKYSSSVASLQAWLEDAEEALSQPENIRQVLDI